MKWLRQTRLFWCGWIACLVLMVTTRGIWERWQGFDAVVVKMREHWPFPYWAMGLGVVVFLYWWREGVVYKPKDKP